MVAQAVSERKQSSIVVLTERLLTRLSITTALAHRQRRVEAENKALALLQTAKGDELTLLRLLLDARHEPLMMTLVQGRIGNLGGLGALGGDESFKAAMLAMRARLSKEATLLGFPPSSPYHEAHVYNEATRLMMRAVETMRVAVAASRDETSPLCEAMRSALGGLKPAEPAPEPRRPPAISLPPSPALQCGAPGWQFGAIPPHPPSSRRKARSAPPRYWGVSPPSALGASPRPSPINKAALRRPPPKGYLTRGTFPALAPALASACRNGGLAPAALLCAAAPHVGGPDLVLGLKPGRQLL